MNDLVTENLSNKEIIFLFEFLKEYMITLDEEESQGVKRKKFVESGIDLSEETDETKASFIEITNKISEIGFSLIKERRKIIIPIMQSFESTYDMIVEVQPELLDEVKGLISGEETKKLFDEALNKIQ